MGKCNKKTFSLHSIMLLLSLVFVFFMSVPVQAEGVADAKQMTPESCFTIDSTTGMITAYQDADASNPLKEVVIPATINGIQVKGIVGAFKDNATVERIIYPNSVTTFGDDAFNGCTALSAIYFYDGNSLVDISTISAWDWASYIYVSDTEVYRFDNTAGCVISKELATIGQRVFNSCAFSSFKVEEGNTAWKTWDDPANDDGDDVKGTCLVSADDKYLYRFAPRYHQNSGSTYVLPAVEEICSYALQNVSKNGGFEIPNTVITIGEYAFYNAFNTTYVNFQETSQVATIGSFGFACINNLGNGGVFTLPASVTKVGEYCFAYCQNIQIDISKSSLESIPAFIFKECNNLHVLTLPATVKTIEAYAFYECDNFNNIYFLGDTLEKIGTAAFQGCQNLHEIDIPEGVTAIENDTFSGCQNLNVIKLPDSLETIGDNAFEDCQNIHEMVIPPNVTYMSNSTFNGVDPEKLENVDTSKNAYAQTKVKKSLPKKNSKWTIGKLQYKITKAHAKKGTVMVVKAKDKKQKTLTIPSTVIINGYTFKVTSIGTKAFCNNQKLTKVTIGANVTTIGKRAFYNCKKLKTIVVKSKKIKSVKSQAFKNINKKAKIKLPKMSKKKFNKYKKKFMNKGQAKTVRITK